jgi:hypothetical protein
MIANVSPLLGFGVILILLILAFSGRRNRQQSQAEYDSRSAGQRQEHETLNNQPSRGSWGLSFVVGFVLVVVATVAMHYSPM